MSAEWQPIETAPKDTWVIAFIPWVSQVRQARYNTIRPGRVGWKVCYSTGQPMCVEGEPSHWMPLPSPPEVGAKYE